MKADKKTTAITRVRKYLDIERTTFMFMTFLKLSSSADHQLGWFAVEPQMLELISYAKERYDHDYDFNLSIDKLFEKDGSYAVLSFGFCNRDIEVLQLFF